MAAEDFFSRWAKKNQEAQEARAAEPAPPPPPDPYEGRAPTLEDLDKLEPQADFSAFMKEGVDESVKRSALKKLFTDPHYNIMDGLDVYIDDYTKSDPIPPEMMAMLRHAKDLFAPPGLNSQPVMAMQSEADLAQLAQDDDNAPPEAGEPPQQASEQQPALAQQQDEQALQPEHAEDQDKHKDGQLAHSQERPASTSAADQAGTDHTSGKQPGTETPPA